MSENRRARRAAVDAVPTTAGAAATTARRALPPSLIAPSFQKISFYQKVLYPYHKRES